MTLARALKPIEGAFRSRGGGRRGGQLRRRAMTDPEIAPEPGDDKQLGN
jgi:hypothetical protein